MSVPNQHEKDYMLIRAAYASRAHTTPQAVIAIHMGLPLARVRRALFWGKRNDGSVNIVNATSGRGLDPDDHDPRNGIKFAAHPTKRSLAGLMFDLRYSRTRVLTTAQQMRTAESTEPDPMKRRLLKRDADRLEAFAEDAREVLRDIGILIGTL